MTIAGVPATALAAEFGTPLFVLDDEDFRARCRSFHDAFPRALFAVKAFPARTLIRGAMSEGLGLLVATGGELQACLRAGADPSLIALHGNSKSEYELEMAVASGVGLLMVDNEDELEALSRIAQRHGAVQDILLRIALGVEVETHSYLQTGGLGAKFGISNTGDRALTAVKKAHSLPGVRLRGIHAHLGSQLTSLEPYLLEVERLFDLLLEVRNALEIEFDVLDLGGGFGVTYTDEVPVAAADAAERILLAVRVAADARRLAVPEVVVEPGRALVANTVVTLYSVGYMKDVPPATTYVAVDGGASDNIRPALLGARYTVAPASPPRAAETATMTVVGRHCDSGDILARDVPLPEDLRSGDLLACAATGAYGYAMASNYNKVGRPAVVAVGGGRARLILRREDDADLGRLEVDREEEPVPTPPPGVTVRPARPRDAAAFHRAWREITADGWVRSPEVSDPVRHYRRLFKASSTGQGLWLVAVADKAGKQVVGHLAITREAHPATEHVASLGLGVVREWRGKGIGSALMAEALLWARSVGVQKVTLMVYPDNPAAIRLYRKFGFVEEGRLRNHSRREYRLHDEILMGRWLD